MTLNHLAHCTDCYHLIVKYLYILIVFYIEVEKQVKRFLTETLIWGPKVEGEGGCRDADGS